MKSFFVVFFCAFANIIIAQEESIRVQFIPTFDGIPIEVGRAYPFQDTTIEFDNIQFYVSNIQLYRNEERVCSDPKSVHLIDVEQPENNQISFYTPPKQSYNRLILAIGIDSVTNVAGALGGDLDPTNGMYWTWQSGYINTKIEGRVSTCPARRHQFQYHLGGYQSPFNGLQNIEFELPNTTNIRIHIPMDRFITKMNVFKNYEIMSPNAAAVDAARLFSSLFFLQNERE